MGCQAGQGPYRRSARALRWVGATALALGLGAAPARGELPCACGSAIMDTHVDATHIPPVLQPEFVPADRAKINGKARVLGLRTKGEVRAYAITLLNRHEVVNDVVGGEPVAVTYCPLAATALVYRRTRNGLLFTFESSGKLWKNTLVLRDRETGSLWSQVTGVALAGPMAGARLVPVGTVTVVRWNRWKERFPETAVLSVEGNQGDRPDHYGGYHDSADTGLFEPEHIDRRLSAKEKVVGIWSEGGHKAYPLNRRFWKAKARDTQRLVQDVIGSTPVVVFHDPGSDYTAVYDRRVHGGATVSFEDHVHDGAAVDVTGNEWDLITGTGPGGLLLKPLPFTAAYWFAWADVYPDTDLYR